MLSELRLHGVGLIVKRRRLGEIFEETPWHWACKISTVDSRAGQHRSTMSYSQEPEPPGWQA